MKCHTATDNTLIAATGSAFAPIAASITWKNKVSIECASRYCKNLCTAEGIGRPTGNVTVDSVTRACCSSWAAAGPIGAWLIVTEVCGGKLYGKFSAD